MGCECCKEMDPSNYDICQKRRMENKGYSPCGALCFGSVVNNRGTNHTPPKKKRRNNITKFKRNAI